jgi:hypothetical protein
MTEYNCTITLYPYGVDGGKTEIDPAALYGYFERKDGSEGGSLWFENDGHRLVLVDYDGVTTLPKAIIECLRLNGATVDADFE